MQRAATFLAPISEDIWNGKYRLKGAGGAPEDASLDDTVWRVARAAASVEKGGRKVQERWAARFHGAIADFGFLPAGRILAGAGTGRAVTLFNCFVMGRIDDDLSAIFENVREAALTMQQGGGIGHDFSTLRPKGAPVVSIGADASGPVSFMDVWDAMCRTIMSAGARRGAMMATLRCDHPDIETFIDAKSEPGRLRNFNLSVLVTDAFVAAVKADRPWDLKFGGKVYRTVPARALWSRIMNATYSYAEPGVIFIDRVNAANNLRYCETISATNPCGEQPLPPYGACLLGSINLAHLVEQPFTDNAAIDMAKLDERVRIAVRLLDNIIDISNYPLKAQRKEAQAKRRIGLGVTGLADALIFSGLRYGTPEAAARAAGWMAAIQRSAYLASAEIAAEKGAFPLFDRDAFLASPNVERLDDEVRRAIRKHGIRNGCLTSIAPTGTISLLAGNVSSGIEPVFDYSYRRSILERDGTSRSELVDDHAFRVYRQMFGADAPLSDAFVKAGELSPQAHVAMQAALQPHVDSAISKTINCDSDISFDEFESIYLDAHALGLKGCTTFRPNPVTGAILEAAGDTSPGDPADPSAPRPAIDAQAPETALAVAAAAELTPVGATVSTASEAPGAAAGRSFDRAGEVVYMSQPLERDAALEGFTYKLKWPGSDHAIYVTINDIERDGRRRPFEVFINTKNLEHYAWTVALTRMISAIFRRGGDVTFVAEELKAVFDPQGGQWMNGHYVPSLLAAIGEVIETHMRRIGFSEVRQPEAMPAELVAQADTPANSRGESLDRRIAPANLKLCPRCSSADYVREEGCWVCRACGYSRCG